MRNLVIGTGLVLVGLAGQLRNLSSSGAASVAPTSASTIKDVAGAMEQSADNPVKAMCDSIVDPSVDRSTWEQAGTDGARICIQHAKKGFTFLLATVPDPEETNLTLFFDRMVASIERAAGDANYTFERYWLPWKPSSETDETNRHNFKKLRAEREQRKKEPGVLIFRGPHPERDLAVFLIGESPVSGVDPQQFRKALDYCAAFCGGPCDAVLGPTFSGSKDSLGQLLPHATFISGTATSLPDKRRENENMSSPPEHFWSMVHQDDLALLAFENFLAKIAHDKTPVAILSETETGFGSATKHPPSDKTKSPNHPPTDKRKGEHPEEPEEFVELQIPFPRGIAYLRNAYQNDSSLSAILTNKTPLPRQALPLTLKGRPSGKDSVPTFAPEELPIAQESVLFQIANTIRRNRIRYTVIRATDVLDQLFLARFLRSACPNTRLVLLDADMLFAHAADTLQFEGILGVVTHPLLYGDYTLSEKPLGPFGSQMEEGVFDAMGFLLNSENTTKSDSHIWVTMLGRDGYWPLAELDAPDGFVVNQCGRDHTFFQPLPRFWILLFCLLNGGVAALWFARYCSGSGKAPPTWCSAFAIPKNEQGAKGRSAYLVVFVASALALYLTLVLPCLRVATHEGWKIFQYDLTFAVVAIFCLLGGLALLIELIRRYRSFQKAHAGLQDKYPHGKYYGWLALISCLVATVVVVLVFAIMLLGQSDTQTGYLYAYRSLQLSSGVCPALPLLLCLTAICWWAWIQMHRVIFAAERRPALPGGLEDVPREASLNTVAKRIDEELWRPTALCGPGTFVWSRFVPFALSFMGVLLFGWHNFRTVDGILFDRVLLLAVASACGLLVTTWWAFLKIWIHLQRFLEQLELHPIRFTLTALPKDYSWSPIWQRNARKRNYTLLGRSIDALTASYLLKGEIPDLERPAFYTFVQQSNEVLAFAARGELEPLKSTVAIQESERAISTKVLRDLHERDWSYGSSDIVARTVPPASAEEFVALRYVHFIRYVMLHLRNLLGFVTTGFILVAFALKSYSFQSPALIAWFITAVFLLLTVGVGWVFVQMDRDPTLSRITNTASGSVDGSFYVRVATVGILPLLTVLSAQFPAVGHFLFSWIEPALSTVH